MLIIVNGIWNQETNQQYTKIDVVYQCNSLLVSEGSFSWSLAYFVKNNKKIIYVLTY